MSPASISSGSWWQDRDALWRFLVDMVAAETMRLRPASQQPPLHATTPETRLDEAGLGFDSLERLQLASAFSEALHLHESGLEDSLLARATLGEWHDVASASLRQFSASLTFRTSGSAGTPRSCAHRLPLLEQEAGALLGMLSGGQRVLSAVPCHHIYGFLFAVLLPHRLGVPVLDLRRHSPGAAVGLARPDDIVVGHPAFWAAVARAASSGWRPGVTGVTSTEACPAETATALRAAGLSRLLQIHGSSETAGLGWRDDPEGPYTLLPHWKRDGGENLRRAPVQGDGTPPAGMAVAPPDRMEWLDDRRYHVRGRLDGAVQVGGVNVVPRHIAEVLRKHPGVADVAVRLMRPSEGMRLKAFVVAYDPATDHELLRSELEARATEELLTAERPRAYSFGSALPTGPMGKAADWQIIPAAAERLAGS